jgi:hypothetical protein
MSALPGLAVANSYSFCSVAAMSPTSGMMVTVTGAARLDVVAAIATSVLIKLSATGWRLGAV